MMMDVSARMGKKQRSRWNGKTVVNDRRKKTVMSCLSCVVPSFGVCVPGMEKNGEKG